ncbi:MAG: serine/threonine-protein kinase [Polyangiaceae bacterium]
MTEDQSLRTPSVPPAAAEATASELEATPEPSISVERETPVGENLLFDEIWEAPPDTLIGVGPITTEPPRDVRANKLQGILEKGSHFGVYLVGECIGEGGMARVYRAVHEGLRRQVALKVLINGFAKDPEGRERFVREARIAAAIKHPNVVNIFDVGVQDEIPFLVMEMLDGTDLEALLVTRRVLDEASIVDIMVPVVAGLTAVHEAGVVHRDLKPGNIFLANGRYSEFEPKLLDFGISKARDVEHIRLTSDGQMMGTPFYMAPEGLRGEEMTPQSDQYSLGVVMYECATGHPPFNAATLQELVQLITLGTHTPSNLQNPLLSKRLARIISRAMALEPGDRFTDLREMGRELLLLAGQRTRITWGLSFGEPRLPAEIGTRTHVLQRQREAAVEPVPAQRRKIAWIAFAPLLLLALIALVIVRNERQRAESEGGATQSVRAAKPEAPLPQPPPGPAAAAPALLPAPVSAPEIKSARAPSHRERVLRAPSSLPRASSAGPSNDIDWATPRQTLGGADSADSRNPSGANGAPIFD